MWNETSSSVWVELYTQWLDRLQHQCHVHKNWDRASMDLDELFPEIELLPPEQAKHLFEKLHADWKPLVAEMGAEQGLEPAMAQDQNKMIEVRIERSPMGELQLVRCDETSVN